MTDRINEITIVTVKSIFEMKAGDVLKMKYGWLLRCPGCGKAHIDLTQQGKGWSVTQHEDGTLTVSPSIWHKEKCNAHFFIERNKIRWV